MKKKYIIPRIYVVMTDYICDAPPMEYGSAPQDAGQSAAKQNNFYESGNENDSVRNFNLWDDDE